MAEVAGGDEGGDTRDCTSLFFGALMLVMFLGSVVFFLDDASVILPVELYQHVGVFLENLFLYHLTGFARIHAFPAKYRRKETVN